MSEYYKLNIAILFNPYSPLIKEVELSSLK